MSQPLLSILIPTVVGREVEFHRLSERLYPQIKKYWIDNPFLKKGEGCIDVQYDCDNKETTIGEKREFLYSVAKGLYSWQIDDDDDISDNAIELILDAIKVHELNLPSKNIDCITFEEHINIDGKIMKSNHSLHYGDWEGDGSKELWDGFHFHRTPFFKSVIKTSIARSVPIPHIRFGEDHQWAQKLHPFLENEVHIEQEIYKYIHVSSNPTERYGLDK